MVTGATSFVSYRLGDNVELSTDGWAECVDAVKILAEDSEAIASINPISIVIFTKNK